ncbi:MAG: hypothetical protein NTW87_04195 [Planctomycetota bacterium]|nr:hypothetical protein [Planctomycetota bacterium]
MSGLGSGNSAKKPVKIAFDYFKANVGRVSSSIRVDDFDYHFRVVELQNPDAADAAYAIDGRQSLSRPRTAQTRDAGVRQNGS